MINFYCWKHYFRSNRNFICLLQVSLPHRSLKLATLIYFIFILLLANAPNADSISQIQF